MAEARQRWNPQDGFRQNVALDGPSRVQDAPPIARRGGNSATMLEQFNVMLRTMAMLSLFAAGEGEETRLSEQFSIALRIKVAREMFKTV